MNITQHLTNAARIAGIHLRKNAFERNVTWKGPGDPFLPQDAEADKHLDHWIYLIGTSPAFIFTSSSEYKSWKRFLQNVHDARDSASASCGKNGSPGPFHVTLRSKAFFS